MPHTDRSSPSSVFGSGGRKRSGTPSATGGAVRAINGNVGTERGNGHRIKTREVSGLMGDVSQTKSKLERM